MSGALAGQDVAGLISSAVLEDRVTIGSVALVAFDFATTFDEEIRLIWSRGKAASAWLYLVVRYSALLGFVILTAGSFSSMSDHTCSKYVKAQALVQFIQSISWAAFSALRTLALSHMNWLLAFIVFVLACAPFAANMWAVSLGVVGFNIPMAGCTASIQVTPYEAKIGTALSRSCTIAADLIVIATTWWNATYDGSVRHIRGASKMPLTRVLLYNGATYFLALSTLNILHLTLTLLSVVGVDEPTSVVVVFTDPLTAILICRFLLALHAANLRSSVQDSQDTDIDAFARTSNQKTMRFASLSVDPLGATLTDGLELDKHDPGDDDELAQSPTSVDTCVEPSYAVDHLPPSPA